MISTNTIITGSIILFLMLAVVVMVFATKKDEYEIKKGYYITKDPYIFKPFPGEIINDECKKLCDADSKCDAYRVYHDKTYKDDVKYKAEREFTCSLYSDVKSEDIKFDTFGNEGVQVSIKNK